LVEDALFCHRCGKAQRELLAGVTEEPVVILPPPPAVPVPPAITFSNGLAVRLCFLVASVASVLDAMPVLQLFCIIWSATAGFVAVVLYRRVTGITLSIRDGARLGWITGVLNSLILCVLTTITIVTDSTDFRATLREQARSQTDPATLALLDSPYTLAIALIFILFFLFVFLSAASVAGGALSARILRDDRAPGRQPR
jgi:hypothetical protein